MVYLTLSSGFVKSEEGMKYFPLLKIGYTEDNRKEVSRIKKKKEKRILVSSSFFLPQNIRVSIYHRPTLFKNNM